MVDNEVSSPTLYALVSLGTDKDNPGGKGTLTQFLVRARAKEVILWGRIFKQQGVENKRLELISDLATLQYLYWNMTKTAPPDDLSTLQTACVGLANNLPVDETSVAELQTQLPESLRSIQTGDMIMATDNAPLEKPGKKGKGKKAASAAGTGTPAAPVEAPVEAKVKKEKDPTGRPSEGTATRKVWDIADTLAAANNNVTPTRKVVIEASVAAGVNKATAGVQYGAWFKGMQRSPAPEPVKEAHAADPATA